MAIHLALIYGSTREGRFCDKVAEWAASEIAARTEFELDLIDPAKLDLSPPPRKESDTLPSLSQRIAAADAFVVITPEYNHSFPAPLKLLIDSVGAPWQAKPVAFVSYGGVSGGLRAVEQLRLVFAELHAVTIRDSVSFANVWSRFDATGKLSQPAQPHRSMTVMLDHLLWWAAALRNARASLAYGSAAA